MRTQFSRQELYNLVWTEPMSVLSKKFGLSDVGMSKACRRANIPIPERGYWNKVYAGKAVMKAQFPIRGLGQSDNVFIGGNHWERPKIDLEKGPPIFDEPLEMVIARAKSILSKITIPKTLSKPHSLIAKLLAADEVRKAKNSPYSWDGPIFDSPWEKRRLRILNAIFSALQQAGCKSDIRDKEAKEVSCVVSDQKLGITLGPLNQKQRENWKRGTFNESAAKELMLEVYQYKDFPREVPNSWADSQDKTLEDQLQEIVLGLLVLGEMQYRYHEMYIYECRLEEKRKAEAEAQRQREELERKRQEEIKRALEKKRAHLAEEATNWQTANNIRAFVAAMENHPDLRNPSKSAAFQQWQAWALSEADRIDPLCTPIDRAIGSTS